MIDLGATPNDPIDARVVTWDRQGIQDKGHEDVLANRAINVESGLPPVQFEDTSLKDEPIAIVGYGPTLRDTWTRLRDFKEIWTTSRAHAFLLERGITPTRHLDVDMRAHKAEFMSDPQKGVKYMLATHIHPSYIEKMKRLGMDTSLFHVAIEALPTRKAKLDPRYPQFKVRFDAGVQTAEVALQAGYRVQHWFGIEYGIKGDQTHADLHWGVRTPNRWIKVNGEVYQTSHMFFQGLLLAEHFLCDRAKVDCTIHGDGLLGKFIASRPRVPRLKLVI